MFFTYVYRPIKNILIINKIIDVYSSSGGEENLLHSARLLISNKSIQVEESEKPDERVEIYSETYISKVLIHDDKKVFFPIQLIKNK